MTTIAMEVSSESISDENLLENSAIIFFTAFECENDIAPFDDVMPSTSPDNLLASPPPSGEPQDYLQGAIQNIEAYQRGLHVRVFFYHSSLKITHLVIRA